MNHLQTIKTTINQKDIEKGQKIIAALYLVTKHLSDTDPMRQTIRSLATGLVSVLQETKGEYLRKLEILLGGAVLVGSISEKNSSIIVYEAKKYLEEDTVYGLRSVMEELFPTDATGIKDIKRTENISKGQYIRQTNSVLSQTKNTVNKSDRQQAILSFINERKSAVIKDIVSLFPEVSEKTIQRELNTLIESGRITKRGSKRWSMYMAVNSLL